MSSDPRLREAQRRFELGDFRGLAEVLSSWTEWADPAGVDAGTLLLRTRTFVSTFAVPTDEDVVQLLQRAERLGDPIRVARIQLYQAGLALIRGAP